MIKKKVVLVVITLIFCGFIYAQQLAFPGAEGYGKYTIGGRGGAVIEVTNLNDSGTGSLRAAVEASGPRTVVFKVSGTITLNKALDIRNPFITIAGQTAPGDGITIRKFPIVVRTDEVIIRYIRVRLGSESGRDDDAMGGRYFKNIIIDHVSASWSVDEVMSFYHCENITVQWCILSEALVDAGHASGPHGFGGIAGSNYGTYHHNLFAHNSSRTPRMSSGSGYFDFRNNVIYNWGYQNIYGAENQQVGDPVRNYSVINLAANYYKLGPATVSGDMRHQIARPSRRDVPTDYGKWYIADNVMEGNATVTANNWEGVNPDGGKGDIPLLKLDGSWPSMPINQQTATAAYESILDNAGCTTPIRDAVDVRVVSETRNGVATYEGVFYKNKWAPRLADKTKMCGMIDNPTDVGGWPVLKSTTPPADMDKDGMPDEWEIAKGLNPNNPVDRNTLAPDGYSMLEKYLNSIEFNSPVDGYELTKLSNGAIQIRWRDAYLAEEGFNIEKSVNGVNYFLLAEELPKNSNTYTDNNPGSHARIYYRVTAYNTDNSTPATTSVEYNTSTAIENNKITNMLNCYPNPFYNKLYFKMPDLNAENIEIKIFDLTGKLVASSLEKNISVSNNRIEWSDCETLGLLSRGVYMGVLQSGEQRLGNVKLFKVQ